MRSGWLGLALLVSGCAVSPATGDREPARIPDAAEVALWRAGAADVVAALGAHPSLALQSYVNRVGQSVAEAGARTDLTWEFTVVEDASVNAFALPGGFIFVTRGLLAQLGSEAELAVVLGHEIAHVTARHAVQELSRQQLAALGLGLGAAVSPTAARFAPVRAAGVGLLFRKYGRDAETQADRLGFGYALAMGWDAREMRGLFAALQRDGVRRGIGRLPTWQATHPDPGDRLRAVDRLVDATIVDFGATRVGTAAYLAEIDGLVYGDDPRVGYFRGSLFVHPGLGVALRFPEEWSTQNTPEAVTAANPEGDAVLELRGATESMAEATNRFVAQTGISASAPQSQRIHGLDAVRISFVASGDGATPTQGVVTFLRVGATTWRVLGFAPPERLPAVLADFDRATESFARLADPAALAMQPRRLRIVTAPRSMSLGEFATQFPSGVPLEELALLNGLASTSTVTAGQLVKQIVGARPTQTAQRR